MRGVEGDARKGGGRLRVLAVATFVAVLLGRPVPAVHADMRMEARSLYRRGLAQLQAGETDAGLAALAEAYAILPRPAVLAALGRGYAAAGRLEESVDALEGYLGSDPDDGPAVERELAALRARIEARQAALRAEAEAATALRELAVRAARAAEPTLASTEELQALEGAAEQTEALADATQLARYRERALRLRGLASTFRARSATVQEAQAAARPSSDSAAVPTRPGRGPAFAGVILDSPTPRPPYEEEVVAAWPAPWARGFSDVGRGPRLRAPAAVSVVSAQDLRLSGSFELAAMLRRVPGVSVRTLAAGDLQLGMRGPGDLQTNRVAVLVDGRAVAVEGLGTVLWSMLPVGAGDLERVEVVRGSSSVLAGSGATSGVVNLVTRAPGDGPGWLAAGVGNAGQVSLSAGVHARHGPLGIRVGGGLWGADAFASSAGSGAGASVPAPWSTGSGTRRVQAGAEASLRLDAGARLRAGVGLATGDVTLHTGLPVRALAGRSMLVAQSFVGLDTAWGLAAQVVWNRAEGTLDGSADVAASAPLQSALRRSDGVDAEVAYRGAFAAFGMEHRVLSALRYHLREVVWDWLAGGGVRQHGGAVVVEDTVRVAEPVRLVMSARGDLDPVVGPQFSPRGVLLVHPTSGQTLRVAGSASFRAPSVLETAAEFALPNDAAEMPTRVFGQAGLRPERLVAVELGSTTQLGETWTLELSAYYQVALGSLRVREVTRVEPGAALGVGADAEAFQHAGAELSVQGSPVSGLDLRASYALHHTDHFAGPRGRFSDDASAAQHAAQAGVQYRAPFGLTVAVDAAYQGAQRWVLPGFEPVTSTLSDQAWSLPAYVVLDARVGYRCLGDALELALLGTNLVDDGHREHPLGPALDRRVMGSVTVRF